MTNQFNSNKIQDNTPIPQSNPSQLQKYQKNGAIYVAENIFDWSYIILFFLMLIIIPVCLRTDFGSFQDMLNFYNYNIENIYPLIYGEIIILLVILFHLYEFFNFRILVTPDEVILKKWQNQRIPINRIGKIGKYYTRKSGTSIEIICTNGEKYSYPINCDIKKLIKFLNQINPNIKMTNSSFLFEELFEKIKTHN